MGARNEKRKSGRKRGEAQSGSAAAPARPRRLQADGENSNVGATDSGKRRVLVWGVPRGARDAPARRLPRRGTVGVPLVSKTSTRLTLNCQILSGLTACFSFRGFGLLSVCLWINLVGICAVGELLL